MKIISISNQKGGCGKTTSAVNLAGALAHLGKKILVVDLDPQTHATFGLGVTSQVVDTAIYNVLTDNREKKRALKDCIMNVYHNIDLVPSNILLSTLEQELKDKDNAVSRLHEVVVGSSLDYDYVIIDCPPSLGFLTFNALRAAELVVVPIDMSAFSLMGVGKLLGMLELIKMNIGHAPRVRALATIFDKRTKYSLTMLNEIRSFFKSQLLDTVIRNSVSLKKAAFAGLPVVQFDADSNGSFDYLALAREILEKEGPTELEKVISEIAEKQGVAVEPAQPIIENTEPVELPDSSRTRGEFVKEEALAAAVQSEDKQAIAVAVAQEVKTAETSFVFDRPTARDVYVVGDFNHWKINDESRLSISDKGLWEKRLTLQPGTYRYKFVVDGEWTTDSSNSLKETNPFGTFDSIIKVI